MEDVSAKLDCPLGTSDKCSFNSDGTCLLSMVECIALTSSEKEKQNES